MDSIDSTGIFGIIAFIIYVILGMIALWGAYCVIMVWMRVSQKRFRNELEQDGFLDAIEEPLMAGDFEAAEEICGSDPRAVPQLSLLALHNREVGYAQVKQLVLDRFQRDVLADLEFRLSWVYTVIQGAPMVGLLGTVVGMMGAFAKVAEEADAGAMAGEIMIALITTASGLAIAIPLVFCTASINVRIRKMEDLVSVGMTRFMSVLRAALSK
ncbi:MAG: biopolymer transporter ExbB [Blastopirellula sp.]|nr:MAG: biopolymer transporter ExbB [Blastopirellula sp.]